MNNIESGISDAELWGLFLKGDDQAYDQLMLRYTNPLYKYGTKFADDEEFICDSIHDVFYELWNRRERIKNTPYVKSYLFKALRLRIFRNYPKWKRSRLLPDDYEFEVSFSIEEQLIAEETLRENKLKLEKLLADLPKRQKEVLYLRFYEDFDHDKIADVMSISKQSVYNLLHEAIKKLKDGWYNSVSLVVISFGLFLYYYFILRL